MIIRARHNSLVPVPPETTPPTEWLLLTQLKKLPTVVQKNYRFDIPPKTGYKEIKIKDCIFEEIEEPKKESKVFNGVYEGKTKFIKRTIRGGQLIEYYGNIVIIGDINSGAEVYAGGNIIVLGSIKGQVHAGVGGNKKAIISAFTLQPEILQIADILTMSPDDGVKPPYPELAKIKGDTIVVEPYLPKKYI